MAKFCRETDDGKGSVPHRGNFPSAFARVAETARKPEGVTEGISLRAAAGGAPGKIARAAKARGRPDMGSRPRLGRSNSVRFANATENNSLMSARKTNAGCVCVCVWLLMHEMACSKHKFTTKQSTKQVQQINQTYDKTKAQTNTKKTRNKTQQQRSNKNSITAAKRKTPSTRRRHRPQRLC